jgi:hypothetical protein
MKKHLALPVYSSTHLGESHATQLTAIGFQTFLFDFDHTLINQHSYLNDITARDIAAMSDTDLSTYFNDSVYLASLLHTLITSPETYVAIVSFGREDVIRTCLSRLLDSPDMQHSQQIDIYTPLSHGTLAYSPKHKAPENKNAFITGILAERTESTTLLIDDNAGILAAAKNIFPHIHTLHVSTSAQKAGLTDAHISAFLAEPHVLSDMFSAPSQDDNINTGWSTPPSSRSTSTCYAEHASTADTLNEANTTKNRFIPILSFPDFLSQIPKQDAKRLKIE